MFPIGNFTEASSSKQPIIITHGDQLENIGQGEMIAPLGDYLLEWDEDCLPPSELERWRYEGDDLCDAVVRALDLKPGQDGLQMVLQHLDLPPEEQDESVKNFWREISKPPPAPISACLNQYYTPHIALRNSTFRPEPSISEGQAVFWRYSPQILSALMHFSLAGGFAAERIVGVLRETNYLTGAAKDKTYRRLLETTQAILDYMNDMTPVIGVGWKSAIRVRLLHSSVRVRIRDKKGLKNRYDEKADGVPINQEDLLSTLGSFAIAPLWTLSKSGIHLTAEERTAYVAVWRHIGFYLGISPSRLERYYTSPHLVSRAEKIFACLTMHIFSFDLPYTDYRHTSTYRILSSVSDRPPRPTSLHYHLATTRFMLGDGLAEKLLLPPTSWKDTMKMKKNMWIEWLLNSFGKTYLERWERQRVDATRTLVSMVVCWQLGVKRTKFTIKEFGADTTVPPAIEKVHDEKADTQEEVDDDGDELDPEVRMGPEAGRAIIKRWRWLLMEMAVVLAAPVFMGLGLSVWLWSRRGHASFSM